MPFVVTKERDRMRKPFVEPLQYGNEVLHELDEDVSKLLNRDFREANWAPYLKYVKKKAAQVHINLPATLPTHLIFQWMEASFIGLDGKGSAAVVSYGAPVEAWFLKKRFPQLSVHAAWQADTTGIEALCKYFMLDSANHVSSILRYIPHDVVGAKYDAIVLPHIIQTLHTSPSAFLQELRGSLNDGGVIYLSATNGEAEGLQTYKFKDYYGGATKEEAMKDTTDGLVEDTWYFKDFELIELFKRAGYRVLRFGHAAADAEVCLNYAITPGK